MSNKPLWLIAYDISCAKRLKKIHKYCAHRGWPMQKSIFLLALTKSERKVVCDYLIEQIDPNTDKLLCLPFTAVQGSFHLVPKSSIILIHSDQRLEGFIN
jgi:CRISPR-associated protein Cas2